MIPPDRILVLVGHELTRDPGVGRITELCRRVGRTDVVVATWSTDEVAREFDRGVFVERLNIDENASLRAKAAALTAVGAAALVRGVAGRRAAHGAGSAGSLAERAVRAAGAGVDGTRANLVASALTTRALTTSVVPRLVVCHDLCSLMAGAALKRRHGSPILYDSRASVWRSDAPNAPWEHRALRSVERRLIRSADVVVAMTPWFAGWLEHSYGIRGVLCVQDEVPAMDQPPAVPTPETDLDWARVSEPYAHAIEQLYARNVDA